jgi:hypothetical protein
MEYHDKKSGQHRVLFDPAQAKVIPKTVLPESEQDENESRRSVLNSHTTGSLLMAVVIDYGQN